MKVGNKEHIKFHLVFCKISTLFKIITIITCDVRRRLYWECTNSTLPSIVLESIWSLASTDLILIQKKKGFDVKKDFNGFSF